MRAAADSARGARAEGCGPCPPSLTGGEKTFASGAKVDWLTVTWLPDADELTGCNIHSLLMDQLGAVRGVEAPGMFGYERGVRFFVDLDGTACHVARLDYGGNHHKQRARLDISGAGCSVVRDWEALRLWVSQQWDVKITRVDLAVDCLRGEFTIEDAVQWYQAGDFQAAAQGTRPRHNTVGDWLKPVYGRTFEVGRRANGKMCRVYEKGRQLGDPDSPWVRFEVEIRNHERDLPLDVLTSPDKYFVGAYRCLERIIAAAGERIACRRDEGDIALERLTVAAQNSYGQLLQVLRAKLTSDEVLDALCRPGMPRRLSKSSLAEFTNAESAPAHLLKVHHETQRCRF